MLSLFSLYTSLFCISTSHYPPRFPRGSSGSVGAAARIVELATRLDIMLEIRLEMSLKIKSRLGSMLTSHIAVQVSTRFSTSL